MVCVLVELIFFLLVFSNVFQMQFFISFNVISMPLWSTLSCLVSELCYKPALPSKQSSPGLRGERSLTNCKSRGATGKLHYMKYVLFILRTVTVLLKYTKISIKLQNYTVNSCFQSKITKKKLTITMNDDRMPMSVYRICRVNKVFYSKC